MLVATTGADIPSAQPIQTSLKFSRHRIKAYHVDYSVGNVITYFTSRLTRACHAFVTAVNARDVIKQPSFSTSVVLPPMASLCVRLADGAATLIFDAVTGCTVNLDK